VSTFSVETTVDAHGHAGQAAVGIGERRAQAEVPRCRVDLGVDGREASLEDRAGKRIARGVRHHAHGDSREVLLRQREVDVDGVDRLKRDNRCACIEVLAEVHLANSHPSGKRRADRLLADNGLDVGDLCIGLFRLRDSGVKIGLRDCVCGAQVS
jgi:hypothetical protein